ncbi:DUF805 domain-containing protein [Xylanimonas ulmi]|uniref:Uncharacterized membrane protein YhaH (DUF805 family) n=1 Tax=Xylanimonas ulmi TaxID=228973 RepID=A0A4Q7M4Z6_9MICO|nr:DUF805 domain-containing protein [Xylanibacterium ulmi]RZS62471.1 uncharacterized membrane protein YhaH (DUF805 family) [Xylanibacterium ulmi]
MSLISAVTSVLRNYATFTGRARRSEYWWFALALGVVGSALTVVLTGVAAKSIDLEAGTIGSGYFVAMVPLWICSLGVLLPSLAVTVRRLHDTDRAGFWILITLVPIVGALVLLVILATPGQRAPNRFGPDPQAESLADLPPVGDPAGFPGA